MFDIHVERLSIQNSFAEYCRIFYSSKYRPLSLCHVSKATLIASQNNARKIAFSRLSREHILTMERRIVEVDDVGFYTSDSTEYFDAVIGQIEDIIMEEEFQNLHYNFLENNWYKFDDSEENKLEYMDIFQEYTATMESFIVDQLTARMGDFDMEAFTKELKEKKTELDGEIFDLLLSLSDFVSFKEIILDYKDSKEGKYSNITSGITVTKIHDDETNDLE